MGYVLGFSEMYLNLKTEENTVPHGTDLENVQPTDRNWKEIFAGSIVTAEQLIRHLPVNFSDVEKVTKHYPMRINPYYLALIKYNGDAIWKQVIPDLREIKDGFYPEDPLSEEKQSPVPNLIHRYPDRVLLLVSNQCAVYCRYCMRRRKLGRPFNDSEDIIGRGLDYIQKKKVIREVLLSGGDPFLLEDEVLKGILQRLRAISHIEVIRIHTRVPCTLPQRITKTLVSEIKKFHPVYINTQFNHPVEITDAAVKACTRLADAGIPLGSQTVLLRGVNDDPDIMKRMMTALLKIRVRPYYIHHADPVRGTGHFRTSIKMGLRIMKSLRGHISGLCIPDYMIDLPGGGGKVPLLPEYVKDIQDGHMVVENYMGKVFKYPLR